MIEVKDINEMIDKFPMYSNVSLPKDVAEKVDDAYISLLIYRDKDRDSSEMPCDKDVFFIEDSPSVIRYFNNIFYEEGKKAVVFTNVDNAIFLGLQPKMFFIDLSAIVDHKNLLKLIDSYPEAKIILMSGIAKYIESFIREMKQLRKDIELDYVLSRNSDVIIRKINDTNLKCPL